VPIEAGAVPEIPEAQRQFFEYAGPLFSVMISPTSSIVEVGGSRALRAVARDRARRPVEQDLIHAWRILEGEGTLEPIDREMATFRATNEPGLTRVEVAVTQGEVLCRSEAQITVTASLVSKAGSGDSTYQGLPGYTYHKAAGELWRSRFDPERNLVVINNGHRDFVYAARNRMLKAPLYLPAVRQGAGAQELCRHSSGSASRAPAGADLVHRRELAIERDTIKPFG
jgi:hypothetical protein